METETKETYQGWANYPTWNVNLWLANEEPLYREALEIVGGQFNPDAETFRIECAGALKRWVRDDLTPDLGASFASDLLGYALDQVDWLAIADAWIEMAGDQDGV